MSFNLSAKEFDYLQKTLFSEPKRAARAAQQEDEINSTDLYLQQHRKPEEQGFIADFTDSVQMGAWQGLSDLSRGLGVVFNSDWLNQAADWAAHNAEANRQTMSSKMQQALGQSAFDGWDSEKGEGKGVLNAYWWAGNFGALLGQQLDTVATLGVGKIATTGLKVAGKQAGKMLSRETAEQIGKAATQQAARFGIPQKYHQSIGVTAVMSAMQAGGRANQVFEEIDQLSDEQLAQLDGFRQDYWDLKESEEGQGLDDRTLFDQAKARFKQRAGKDAALDPVALATDLTTNAISGLGGGFWGAMKPAQTLKGSFFKGGAIEAITEGMQGAAETYAVNDTARNFYDTDRALTDGMGRNVVDGMVLGGVMGAGMGAMNTHSHNRTMNRERRRYVEAIQTGDTVIDAHLRNYVETVNNAANDIDELISQSRFNAMHTMAQKEARAKQVMAEVQAEAEQAVGSEGEFAGEEGVKFSRSAMKSVEANIARGREAMTRAILDKADVKRGMYNQEFGWVDFVWGDDGTTKPLNERGEPRGRGIAHIFEARERKDNIGYQDTARMLVDNIVETIAKGAIATQTPKRLVLDYKGQNEQNGHRVILTKEKGSNAWILSGYEKFPVGGNSQLHDKTIPTQTLPTRSRQDLGATGFKQHQPMNQSRGATTSDLRNIDPIRSRIDMGATGENTLLQTDEQGNSFKLSRSAQETPSFYETEQRLGGKEAYESAVRNGETELDYRQWVQVRTPEFKAWFGDWENDPQNASKVINPRTGEPLVVFHGSSNYGFNTFKDEGVRGIYFTDNQDIAESYFDKNSSNGGYYGTFLNIHNPSESDFEGQSWNNYIDPKDNAIGDYFVLNQYDEVEARFTKESKANQYIRDNTDEDFELRVEHIDNVDPSLYDDSDDIKGVSTDYLTIDAKSRGYNGAIYRNVRDRYNGFTDKPNDTEANVFVAFKANQIKSATDNTGAFDTGNDDIRFSKALQKPDRLEKLRQAKPIEIAGNEIPYSDDFKQYRKNILKYGLEHIKGDYVNKDTGRKITVVRGSVNELMHHDMSSEAHIQSITAVPKIIEEGIYIDTLPNEDRAKNPDIKEYEYYVAGLKIDGEDYTVKSAIGVSTTGHKYYDHKLTKIEKGNLLEMTSRLSNAEISSSSPLSEVNDKRLLQILQQQKANLAQTHAQIKQIVGNKLAAHFEVVSREQMGIDDPTVEAGYDTNTGKIFIVEDNIRGNSILSRDERLKWVVWHELAHRGIQVKFAHQYRNLMTKIEQNTTVRELANAIQQQREETRENRLLAVEEALAELNAAYTTGKMEELKSRYGIKVPPMREKQLKTWLEITAQRIREFMARLFGKERAEQFSHDDLLNLLKDVQGAMGGEINGNSDIDVKQSVDEQQKHRSFNQTAEQYGGKQAYEQAKTQGKTELDYRQWVQVRTPEFKAWFGDWENDPQNASKVVNPKTGEPLVVYHGSKSKFFSFDKGKQGNGWLAKGFYFTPNKDYAKTYGRSVNAVFLKSQNPFLTKGDSPDATYSEVKNHYSPDQALETDFTDTMRKNGHDGAYLNHWDVGEIYSVFNPNQIKSATDNTGAFDVGNDDIRYSSNEKPTAEFAEAEITPERQAYTFSEAREQAKAFQGKEINNRQSNVKAVVSRNSLDKMLSAKAVSKSVSPEIHSLAVANADKLYENALYGWSKPDRDNNSNIVAIHRMFAVLNSGEGKQLVKLTVKETAQVDRPNRLYTIEAVELNEKTPAAQWVGEILQQDNVEPRTIRSAGGIYNLAQSVEKSNLNGFKFSRSQSNVERLRKINESTPLENITDMAKAMASRPLSEWKSLMLEYGKRANTKIFDALAPIKYAEDKAGITDHSQSAYTAARLAAGSASISEASMLYGLPEYHEGIIQRKQGTGEQDALFGILQSLGNDANDFLAWVAGNRADKLMQEGRENHLSQAEINELKALNKGKEAKFEQARQKLMAWNQSLLDLAEDAGLINKEDRAKWEDKDFYIPFYRESEDGDAIAPYRNKGLSGQNAGIKRLKGSDKAINDLLENVITNATKLIDASVKNIAMTKAVTNLADTGVITLIENPTSFDWKKLGSNKHGADKDGGVAMVRIDGKEQLVRINDAMLFNAITSIDQQPLDYAFRKLFAGPKRVLTATVTSMPNFIVRNFLRDMAQAWVVDRNNGFKLGIDSIKGLKDAYKRTGSSIDLMFAGASFGAGYVNGGNPQEAAVHIRKHLRKKGKTAAEIDGFMDGVIFTKDKLSSVLDKYFHLNHSAENANRIAVYDRAIASGKSKAQAALESKDLMDFSMHGSAKALRILGDVLPFFNARLQGMSQLGRAFKENPRALATRGAMIALASVALAAMNQGEDWYEEQGDDIKDNFWLANLGGQIIKIPKPFELGVVFGTVPERLYRTMSGADSTGRFKDRLLSAITNTLSLNPIPQAVKPILEVYNNYDSFRGREIETLSDRRLMKEARYDDRTSLVSRGIAGLTSVFGLSPKQTDYLIHGYFGTLGMYVLGMSDLAIRQAGGYGELPAKNWQEYPVLDAVFGGDVAVPRKYTRYMNDYYNFLNQVSEISATVKSYKDDGRLAESNQLKMENARLLSYKPVLSQTQKKLKAIKAEMDTIQQHPNLSAEQKRQRLDRLRENKNAIVRMVIERMEKEDF